MCMGQFVPIVHRENYMTLNELVAEFDMEDGHKRVILVGPDGESPLEVLKVEEVDGSIGIFAQMPIAQEEDA